MMDAREIDAAIERGTEASRAVMAFAARFDGVAPKWGFDDCSMWPAMWIAERCNRDLEIPAYDSEDDARAMIASAGSLANLWSDIASRNAIAATVDPQAGDVGVIHTALHGQIGCIFAKYGLYALFRTVDGWRGIGIAKRHVVGAWRVA